MTKSLIALAFAAACGLLAFAVPEVAQSQVTISGCSNPVWTASTSTLSCGGGGSGPPSCTISGNANGTINVADVLTANCSPAATSWSWTGGNCAGGIAQTCAATEAATGVKGYTVTGTNAQGTGSASPTFNVTWYSTSGPPQGCAIAPSSQSMGSAGGAITPLVVTCAGGAPLTTFAWARSGNCGGTGAMSSTATQTDSIPANTLTSSLSCTYTATVDNGSGTPQAPTATVTVAGKTTAIDCKSSPQGAALGITGNTSTVQIPWVVDSGNTLLTGNGTIAAEHPGMAVVGVIQVPAGAPMSSSIGRIDLHEYGSTPLYRLATISQTPCAFGGKTGDGVPYTQFQLDPNFYFTVGPNSSGYVPMAPGSTWYVNIVMQDPNKTPPQGEKCKNGDPCNFVIEFWKPNGS